MVLLDASVSKGPAMDREDAFFHVQSDEKTSPRAQPLQVDDALVRKALEIIWSPSEHPLSVSDIARQLPVTRRTLDRRFAEAIGHSVLEEINRCRLDRAKRLLEETDLPVKNVAHQAGFSSTERMRVLFVERVGLNPTDYRKRACETSPNKSGSSENASRKRDNWPVSDA
jgi:transcriptional regulator GlxA family with amidase domain